ncbi:MAG: hypothetical protein RLY14_1986 [Planctomycetota bacterium]|jgi:hypothetical protein
MFRGEQFAEKLGGFEEPVGDQVNLKLTVDTAPIIIVEWVVSMRAYLCASMLLIESFGV